MPAFSSRWTIRRRAGVHNPETAKAIMSALLEGRDVALAVEAAAPAWLTAGGARFASRGELEVRSPIAPIRARRAAS